MIENVEHKAMAVKPDETTSPLPTQRDAANSAAPQRSPAAPNKPLCMRRTQRVHFRTGVLVYGKRPNGNLYIEETHTAVVNANGALVLIAAPVTVNEKLLLVCQQTTQESECTVVWIGDQQEGKREVGVGFVEPRPQFWGMTFPPEDWDPATRKLPTSKSR